MGDTTWANSGWWRFRRAQEVGFLVAARQGDIVTFCSLRSHFPRSAAPAGITLRSRSARSTACRLPVTNSGQLPRTPFLTNYEVTVAAGSI